MKPKSSAVKGRLAPLALVLTSQLMAQPAGDLAAHQSESDVKDSVRAALPFLEDKVASTIMNGASTPVAFNGQLQIRSRFHSYYGLEDSSYLYLTRQGLTVGNGSPLLKLGMIVSPGRSTVMWAAAGFSASYHGVNQSGFLAPGADGFSPVVQHNNANVKNGVLEDLNAGIAIRTKPASFMLKMGAVNWEEASPLSVWRAQPRMFVWEYLPYEIEGPISEYYGNNLARGEMVGRSAWNKRPFQGVEFAATDLPKGWSGFMTYGAGTPYDVFDRSAIDMAVDVGYAGDAGSIIETGIGDSYRHQLFYRIAKNINPRHTVGFNNGYIYTSNDIVNAGFKYDYIFNSKYDVGLYGSSWKIGEETVVLNNRANFEKIANASGAQTALTVGQGFWMDPKVFTVDGRGKIGKKLSYFADLGMSFTDTTYVSISNKSYSTPLTASEGVFAQPKNEDNVVTPGAIYEEWNSDMLKYSDIAAYLELGYSSKTNVSVDLMYAGKEFYSPFSMVLPYDVFFARGSNLLGAGKFLGAEASPYTKNMVGAGVTVKPNLPGYGHLKVKYGMNRQLSAGRDILYFPYRLNGSDHWESLNSFFSKYALGNIDQTYDYDHWQTRESEDSEKANPLARHPVKRLGDESYGTYNPERTILSPTSGGLRGDDGFILESFVPYSKPQDVIFNHFAKSSLVEPNRDLSQIWNDSTGRFDDNRNRIDSVRIIDGEDTTFYSMTDNSNELVVRNSKGDELSREEVSTQSETGFVPMTLKNSFDFSADWSLDIGKYIGYDRDLFMSLYYEINGVTKNLAPLAFKAEGEDVMMVSHYIRSEPAIALTKKFYLLGLVGWERWMSGNGWILDKNANGDFVGFSKTKMETTDLALGLGFDWDCFKRTSLHGRYKWINHGDEAIPDLRYQNHSLALELKAFF